MKEMTRLAKEKGVNIKMTYALKGSRYSLERIVEPKFD